MMIMIGSPSDEDWDAYIAKPADSEKLRGGSALGNGARIAKGITESECSVTGYIRLEVSDLKEAKALLAGNPLFEAGGAIELPEEIPD